jgi:hypothetical protein
LGFAALNPRYELADRCALRAHRCIVTDYFA